MRIVLYSAADMEPVTVLELPLWAMQMMADGRQVNVPVPSAMTIMMAPDLHPGEPIARPDLDIVTVWAEPFIRRGQRHWLFFTSNDELALRLRSSVLPGQRSDWHDQWRRGFVAGLLSALQP